MKSGGFVHSGNGIAKWPLPFFVLRSQDLRIINFEFSKLDGKEEDSFLFGHGIDFLFQQELIIENVPDIWIRVVSLEELLVVCHMSFRLLLPGTCVTSHASLPGEVIKTMVNGKEETRNTAQENDFVVQLGF